MITETVQPLTGEELVKKIINNKSRIMFTAPGLTTEELMRSNTVNHFDQLLLTYSPVYASNVADIVHETYIGRH